MKVGDKVLWCEREVVIKEIKQPINDKGFFETPSGWFQPPYTICLPIKGIGNFQIDVKKENLSEIR